MNQNEQTNQLTDLEPTGEVKGGDSGSGTGFYGTGVYKSVDSGRTWTL